jgi:hypothetical protein
LRCFRADINKYLTIIRVQILEFRASRFLGRRNQYNFLEKLEFIDQVLSKYSQPPVFKETVEQSAPITVTLTSPKTNFIEVQPMNQKTGILPRSIGRTFHKIQDDIRPKSEEELLQNFRKSRRTTRQALQTLLLLILVPLIVQKTSKQFLILPWVEKHQNIVFLNGEMKEEVLKELRGFEEELKFDSLLGEAPRISPEDREKRVCEKVQELAEEFRWRGQNAVSNCLADILSFFTFLVLALSNPQGINFNRVFIIAVSSYGYSIVDKLTKSFRKFS